jgi:hypothetical protein
VKDKELVRDNFQRNLAQDLHQNTKLVLDKYKRERSYVINTPATDTGQFPD